MMLIVGGRYGALASDQKEKYEEQYASITRKEYETARKKGIPVMVFVEQNVFTEYKTYVANQKNLPAGFKYAFVDDARVFEFIANLEQGAIKIFAKVDDIECYFSHQIAGMLLSYLKQLQINKADTEIKNAVDEIKVVSQSMRQMVNSIAEEVLKDSNKNNYQDLLRNQNQSLIDFFIELVDQNIEFDNDGEPISEKEVTSLASQICTVLNKNIFNKKIFSPIYEDKDFEIKFSAYRKMNIECAKEIANIRKGIKFEIDIFRFDTQLAHILDLIEQDQELKNYFKEKLLEEIQIEVAIL